MSDEEKRDNKKKDVKDENKPKKISMNDVHTAPTLTDDVRTSLDEYKFKVNLSANNLHIAPTIVSTKHSLSKLEKVASIRTIHGMKVEKV